MAENIATKEISPRPGQHSRRSIAHRELLTLIENATARAGTVRGVAPGVSLSWLTAPVGPASHLHGPSLCVCLRGRKQISLGDRDIAHSAGQFLLTAIQMPIVSVAYATPDAQYVGLELDLDLDLARQVIAEVDLHQLESTTADPCLAIGELSAPLLDAVLRLVRLIETPSDIPILGQLIQHEILYRLAIGPKGNRLRQIVRLGSKSHGVAKVIAWLREHFAEKLQIAQLADQAGMGVSTLHRHFSQLTTMSPIQYQNTCYCTKRAVFWWPKR